MADACDRCGIVDRSCAPPCQRMAFAAALVRSATTSARRLVAASRSARPCLPSQRWASASLLSHPAAPAWETDLAFRRGNTMIGRRRHHRARRPAHAGVPFQPRLHTFTCSTTTAPAKPRCCFRCPMSRRPIRSPAAASTCLPGRHGMQALSWQVSQRFDARQFRRRRRRPAAAAARRARSPRGAMRSRKLARRAESRAGAGRRSRFPAPRCATRWTKLPDRRTARSPLALHVSASGVRAERQVGQNRHSLARGTSMRILSNAAVVAARGMRAGVRRMRRTCRGE